jgi:hypothetical protein
MEKLGLTNYEEFRRYRREVAYLKPSLHVACFITDLITELTMTMTMQEHSGRYRRGVLHEGALWCFAAGRDAEIRQVSISLHHHDHHLQRLLPPPPLVLLKEDGRADPASL